MSKLSNISFEAVCERLLGASSVLILTHRSPDGDTLGSGFALRELLRGLGKSAEVINPDGAPKYLDFIFSGSLLNREELSESFTPDLVVAVDVASAKLLGELEAEFASKCDLAIDHHALGTPFARETYVGDTGSCGEIIADIFEYFKSKGKSLMTRSAAMALYTAISSDTGSFKYDSVTAETHMRVARLMEAGINHAEISRRIFDSKPMSQMIATRLALDTLKLYHSGKIAVVHFTDAMLTDNGLTREDTENIIDLARTVEGVEVGISVKQASDDQTLFKVSMRSSRVADVAKLCALFGGGGHVRAGGCTVKAKSMDEAIKLLTDAVDGELTKLENEGAFNGADGI